MPHRHDHQRNQCSRLEEGLQAQREAQGLVGSQAPRAQEEGAAPSSSTVTLGTLEEAAPAAPQSPPGSPQGASSSSSSLAFTPEHRSNEGSSSEEEEWPSSSEDPEDPSSVLQEALENEMCDLVHFLLLKYRFKEPITKAEMLDIVIKDYQDHFPVILSEASECMQMVFGIDVKEVDPAGHSYVLVTTLGLTYYEELNDDQSFPKAGLLIIMLGLILFEGDCAREEVIWDALGGMGVHAGSEHYIYGEPRKLITQDWVQEGYLEYRQVPNSDPAYYEFLWGPRAHAEASKVKVLEYVLKVNWSGPRSFPFLYEESVSDEEEEV
ncbi:PREDICTED: melanoma-associated antigen 8-like [Propithecus coquereli]|uniref:melanoma-associated antigen 8-like n=1 Tax=Propithecus coquereli TaxID=379532 RepID=UPI00063EDC74|nr:PREDICTED: melanoma-associated antigen 8-like [Propithecus coquereli]